MGENNFLPNYVVSDMNAKKLLRNECSTYLTYMKDVEQGGMEINNLLIIKEFSCVSKQVTRVASGKKRLKSPLMYLLVYLMYLGCPIE